MSGIIQKLLLRAPIYLGAFLLLLGGEAFAYEEPKYDVVREYEEFELRRYAPCIVAETEVTGEFWEVGKQAFRVLVNFISGNNRKAEEIPMTMPVSQKPVEAEGEKIPMTAPVTQTPQGEGDKRTYLFSFVMPSKYTLKTLPKPVDPNVRIREIPGRLMAAREYSGMWSEDNYRKNEAALLKALKEAGFKTLGKSIFARYNSPYSIWFLRRNEVLIEVVEKSGSGNSVSTSSEE